MVWKEKSFQHRLDICEVEPSNIDYESRVALLRNAQKKNKKGNTTASHTATHLRTLLTGAVHSQDRLFKANRVEASLCPFCHQCNETVEHIFWECSAWELQRHPFLIRYDKI